MQTGDEPIADDEILYRRIPASTGWYSPDDGCLGPQAFAPNKKRDATGLSVDRAKYKSVEEAAVGRPGKTYYVAVLRAGDLIERGIRAEPRPLPDDPGHAELPDLNAANRKSDRVLEFQQILVRQTLRVEGPFPAAEVVRPLAED